MCWWYLIWAAVEEYPHLAKCDDEIAADERLQTFEFLMTCVSVYTPHSRDFHYRVRTSSRMLVAAGCINLATSSLLSILTMDTTRSSSIEIRNGPRRAIGYGELSISVNVTKPTSGSSATRSGASKNVSSLSVLDENDVTDNAIGRCGSDSELTSTLGGL